MADSDQTQYEEDDALPAEAEEDVATDEDLSGVEQSTRPRFKWGRLLLVCIFAFLLLAAGLFVWNRWYRFDDAADIQGTWRDVNTGTMLELDSSHLKIAGDVVYTYTLDTFAKTISYSLGNDNGFSSYRFSENRQELVLEDGANTDWGLVLHFRDDPGFAEGELPVGLTRLEKVSNTAPNISLPGSSRDKNPLLPQAAPASSSSSSSSSSSAASTGSAAASGTTAASSTDTTNAAATNTIAANGMVIPEAELEAMNNGLLTYNEMGELGYFDAQGNWVRSVQNWTPETDTSAQGGVQGTTTTDPATGITYDALGNIVDSGGTYDAQGNWVGGSGYYDTQGNWIDTTGTYDAQGNYLGNQSYGYGATGAGYVDNTTWTDTTGSTGVNNQNATQWNSGAAEGVTYGSY